MKGDPTSIAGHRVLRRLGAGGMGVVYAVEDLSLPRVLALKTLQTDEVSSAAVYRFLQEGYTLAKVRHPGVVRVHRIGHWEGGVYLTMDLVAGRSLDAEVAARGPLTPDEAATIVAEVADAVEAVHAAGILHRDLKPENVLLGPGGRPVLLDFGLARDASLERLTQTGVVVGTLRYMAPEQAEGAKAATLTPATDVFGLGGILYALLAGRAPREGTSVAQLIAAALREVTPIQELRSDVPADLARICARALHVDPSERYAGAADLGVDLRRFLRGEPLQPTGTPDARRTRTAVAAILGLVALSALGGLATGLLARPRLTASELPAFTAERRLFVSGRVAALVGASLRAERDDGSGPFDVPLDGEGGFSLPVRLQPGENTLRLVASDALGRRAEPITLRCEQDAVPPEVTDLSEAWAETEPGGEALVLSGVVSEPGRARLNDEPWIPLSGGPCELRFWPHPTEPTRLELEDRCGNRTTREIHAYLGRPGASPWRQVGALPSESRVYLPAGRYVGSLSCGPGRSLSFIGAGRDATRLVAFEEPCVAVAAADEVIELRDLSIEQGPAAEAVSPIQLDAGRVELQGCLVRSAAATTVQAEAGTALHVAKSTLAIAELASQILAVRGAEVRIVESLLEDQRPGGTPLRLIEVAAGSSLELLRTTVRGRVGSGLRILGSRCVLREARIEGFQHDGLVVEQDGRVEAVATTFSGIQRRALVSFGGTLRVQDGVFEDLGPPFDGWAPEAIQLSGGRLTVRGLRIRRVRGGRGVVIHDQAEADIADADIEGADLVALEVVTAGKRVRVTLTRCSLRNGQPGGASLRLETRAGGSVECLLDEVQLDPPRTGTGEGITVRGAE